MKDLRLVLPIFLLILLVLLFAGCKGVVPSPGATEDNDTAVIGQIRMPFCCLTVDEMQDTENTSESAVNRYSGYECGDETQLWRPAPKASVVLRAFDDCKVEYTTTTDDSGYYEFTDVKPGMYILTTYCPTDEGFFVKDVIEKSAGEALDAGIPDCDSTSLSLVIEYIGDTYCHCQFICPCFNEEWSAEYKLIEEIANSDSVNMQVDIPAIIAHEKFGTLCNVDSQGESIEDDLVDLVCSKLNGCCISPGVTGGNGDDDPCEDNEAPVIDSVLLNGTSILSLSIQNIEVGTEYELIINASDDNILPKPANPLTYSVNITKDADPPFDINMGTANSYTGTPVSTDVGEYAVVLSVNDGCDSTDFEFTAVVEEPPTGSLTIEKDAGEDTDTTFNFNIKGPDFGVDGEGFTLTGGNSKTYSNLSLGDYTIAETDPGTGWSTTVKVGDGAATAGLSGIATLASDGDAITVVFENTYTPPSASLTIKKIASGAGCGEFDTPYPGSDWEFSITGPDSFSDSFSLEGEEEKSYTSLTPGTYTITETQTWDYSCSVAGSSVDVVLADGDDREVTFTNTWGFDRRDRQHIMVTNASAGLQTLVDEHPDGVLASMMLSSGSGDYPNPYFYVDLETYSGSFDEEDLNGWCITRYKGINTGSDYTVILFPADNDNPSIGNKIKLVWGILDLASSSYTMNSVQNAIWKATDNIYLNPSSDAYYLWDNAVETTGSGIIAIPVTSCSNSFSLPGTLSRDIGIPVDKSK